MKLLLNIYLFLLICISAYSQHQENSKTIIKQNHFTKEMVFLYSYRNNVPEKTPSVRYEIAYNNEGNIIERKWIPNNKVATTVIFSYDSSNKLLKEATYTGSNLAMPTVTTSYEYDVHGNEISSTDSGYKKGAPPSELIKLYNAYKKVYNDKNQLTEVIYDSVKMNTFFKLKQYSYNSDGSINKIFYYSQNDELFRTETYTYKKNGDTEMYVLDKAGKSKKTNDKFYNRNKQLVKEIGYFYKSNITEYSYNEDGTLFEKKSSFNGIDVNLERHYYRPIGTNLNF